MGFVCKRQGTQIKPPNQLNSTLTDTSWPALLLAWWFTVGLMLEWLGGSQRSCVGTKSLQGSVQSVLLCWELQWVRQGNNDLQEEPSPKHTKPKLPLNTHKAKSFQQRGSLLRLPAQITSGTQAGTPAGWGTQGCGTQHHPPQGLLCPGFVPVGLTHHHCSPPPGCQSILHPREYPSKGLGGGEGSCCSSSALFCSVLSVQLPKTQSHKTQFTIPAAFWHPTVLAYR